jgi:uncharacterized protein YmfQ (DUF2313 family)
MRTAAAVQAEALALSPPGKAYPKTSDSYWGRMLLPLATELSRVEGLVETLPVEIDPRQADYLLPEWKALFGPDPYGRDISNLSTAQWQAYLYQQLTMKGGQSPAFYEALAASMGVQISITEYQLPVYGDPNSVYDEVEYTDPGAVFCWTLTLPSQAGTDAEYGTAQYGDPYGSFEINQVQPVIEALAPLHTTPIFSYTG